MKFIKRYLVVTNFLNTFSYTNLQESLCLVDELLSNKSIGVKTREKLTQINYYLNNLFDEEE